MDRLCRHRPGPVNRWCPDCDALIIAGTYLDGPCGHTRLFPPEFTWAPRSWCPNCERFADFGVLPAALTVYRPPSRTAFWERPFLTTPADKPAALRPLSLYDLGEALRFPSCVELARRSGAHRRQLYRWRDYGLTAVLADTLAINVCLHPLEVWGEAWEAA